jgi:hypothetical protein
VWRVLQDTASGLAMDIMFEWHAACPPQHKPFVEALALAFGVAVRPSLVTLS